MNYNRHYELLIFKAKNRILTGYVERHHVIPKCLGGNNSKTNIIILTPEEHYVAHQLLVKIYPNNYKLIYAAYRMCFGSKSQARNNRLYAWLKKKKAKATSEQFKGKKQSEYQIQKLAKIRSVIFLKEGNPFYGKKHSEEAKRKISESNKNRIVTEEVRNRISCAIKGSSNPNAKFKPFSVYKNNEQVGLFNYIFECSETLKLLPSGIHSCLNGMYKSYRKFTFKYK